VHERYKQTTHGRTIAYSERELEFTFAKNSNSTEQRKNDGQFNAKKS